MPKWTPEDDAKLMAGLIQQVEIIDYERLASFMRTERSNMALRHRIGHFKNQGIVADSNIPDPTPTSCKKLKRRGVVDDAHKDVNQVAKKPVMKRLSLETTSEMSTADERDVNVAAEVHSFQYLDFPVTPKKKEDLRKHEDVKSAVANYHRDYLDYDSEDIEDLETI